MGWRKEEERGVNLWVVVVVERKGVEFRDEDEGEEEEEGEEEDACGKSMSLEEAVAEERAMVLEMGIAESEEREDVCVSVNCYVFALCVIRWCW